MTTHYAQQVHLQAREDIARRGSISAKTSSALLALGYGLGQIAHMERRLLDAVRDLDHEAAL